MGKYKPAVELSECADGGTQVTLRGTATHTMEKKSRKSVFLYFIVYYTYKLFPLASMLCFMESQQNILHKIRLSIS